LSSVATGRVNRLDRMATRRELLIALGAGALAWAGAVFAQSKQPVLIGWGLPVFSVA